MSEQTPSDPPKDGVPPELIDQLHQANKQLTRAREHLEEAQASTEFNGLARREQACHEIQQAEQELEKVDEKIEMELP